MNPKIVSLLTTLSRSMSRRTTFVARVAVALLLTGVCTGTLVGVFAPPDAEATRPGQAQSPPPKALIVVDADTGAVLMADHEHDVLLPASTAKVMTALTAVERLPADALITVSDRAAGQPASRIAMVAGNQWRFEDALASLMMASANDAAYAIAEAAGGSVEGFVPAMDQTAERTGMQDSTFADPAGLDDEFSFNGGSRMSAYDIAVATRNAMSVPEIAKWAALREHEFVDPTGRTRSLTNHNRLLPGGTRAYPWATGFKTGFTERAGHTITATSQRDGRTLIAVVLDTYDTYGWAAQLFEQAFAIPSAAATTRLPEVAVSLYGERVAEQRAFTDAVRGTGVAPAVSNGSEVPTTASPPSTTTPSTSTPSTSPRSSVLAGSAISAQAQAPDDESADDQSGGGDRFGWFSWFSLRNVIIVLVVLLVITFALRRRIVRRQRERRISRQRLRAAKMRSGALQVVDGRFRVGTRTGPPVESHVKIRRDDE